jgi:hypothetical protein
MNKAIMKARSNNNITHYNPFTHVTNSKHLLTAYQTISDSRRCAALAWLVKSRSLQQLVVPLQFPIQHPPLAATKAGGRVADDERVMSPKSRAEMIPY